MSRPRRVQSVSTAFPTAVILCGGLGTRLLSVVADRPKPMAPVLQRPFLEWIVLAAREQGVDDFVLATGHRGGTIEDHFGDGRRLGVRIRYSPETAPLGTAGALLQAMVRFDLSVALVLNGDSMCDFEVDRLRRTHSRHEAHATLWVVRSNTSSSFGSVELTDDDSVSSFTEKTSGGAWVSAGAYIVERHALDELGPRATSLERQLFPSLAGAALWAVRGEGPLIDIGTPRMYHAAGRMLPTLVRSVAPTTFDNGSSRA